ncbi:MAG: hypothetical protein HQL54_11390 [Magnetococcales bacterium]|nr:hypothetical protein [Magnetococcales bacterium]
MMASMNQTNSAFQNAQAIQPQQARVGTQQPQQQDVSLQGQEQVRAAEAKQPPPPVRPPEAAEKAAQARPQLTSQPQKKFDKVTIQQPEPVVTAIQEKVENLFQVYPNGGVKTPHPGFPMESENDEAKNGMPKLDLQA